MQVQLTRGKKTGMMGGASYTLQVRAVLTDEEKETVNKNGLSSELLVYHEKTAPAESLTGAILKNMRDTKLTVSSFVNGTTFTRKNVAELVGIEEEVRQAALNLRSYIELANNFGGTEVIDVDAWMKREIG